MIEIHKEADARANRLRADLGLGSQPVPDILPLLEDRGLGLIVFVQPWPEGPLGAYLPRDDHKYVFLNGDETFPPRFRFTSAHELGHHVFGDGPQLDLEPDVYDNPDLEEKRANSFAASFLLPREGIAIRLDAVRRKVRGEDVRRIASEFGVSYQMATYRMNNLGFINAARREELLQERSSVLTPEFRQRVDRTTHLPAAYVDNALDAYRGSRISFDALVGLLRIEGNEDRRYLARQLDETHELHADDARELHLRR
jgi:Zn-dependent peptidase ImmA (M78 family)